MRNWLAVLAMAAAVIQAAPALAQSVHHQAALVKAVVAAQACADHMPDRRATSEVLRSRGFKPREAQSGLKAFTAVDQRTVVLLTHSGDTVDPCAVTVRRMSLSEAEALIQPWVTISDAKPYAVQQSSFDRIWLGTFKGTPIELSIS
ncbi:MAG: hypothetical protein ACU0DH_04340 [Paracoccus sp. (in: a-proteobacteria)]|uniref:hypothetical protein n=1 Tax=Paracoccus sp. TaxID=267 RepID=UPI002E8BCA21|nr:hypothetical protein [Pseudomonadota bacterium]